jgi:hypothetical protein
MSMTRKHYVSLADDLNNVLRRSLPDTIEDKASVIFEVAQQMANTFRSDNPHFSQSRFLDAAFAGFEQYRPDVTRN